MPNINAIWAVTSIITGLSNGQSMGSATGFFYSNNGNLYLVTNKHVIYGNDFVNGQPLIDTVRLNLHSNPNNLTQNEEVSYSLFEGANKKWLEHTIPEVDVILLPLTFDRTRYTITPIDETYMELTTQRGRIIVDDFQKIFVMGYPFGWYDNVNNLPITRIGHLSSPFRVPFRNMPLMMGDVTTHQGMSGGPVLMLLEDYTVEGLMPNTFMLRQAPQAQIGRMKMMGERKLLLVGINSGQFVTPEGRIDLISIWFPDIIPQILGRAQT